MRLGNQKASMAALVVAAMLPIFPALSFTDMSAMIERAQLVNFAKALAAEYHLSEDHFLKTIQCESQWDPNAQSGYFSEDGKEENSWGVAQWNLDTNTITKEEALNPEFALTKMAEAWQEGKAAGWKCYQLWAARNWK